MTVLCLISIDDYRSKKMQNTLSWLTNIVFTLMLKSAPFYVEGDIEQHYQNIFCLREKKGEIRCTPTVLILLM